MAARRRRSLPARLARGIAWASLAVALASVAVVAGLRFLPVPVTAFMIHERIAARESGVALSQRHDWVPWPRISRHAALAVLAAEDQRFYFHDGFDFAAIEKAVTGFAERARNGSITIEELTGGTFSITNGGVFGSLLSTPIVNAPQSAILGMHKVEERPVVVAGEISVRPMMYVALTYDHRIIDGREAVQFLVAVKEAIEDPARLLLQV